MARRGNLQTAAHHRTVQDGNHRCPPEFDALEGAMPAARMGDGLADVARGELVEVEPGTEVLALAGQHDRLDRFWQLGKERLDPGHGRIVDGVALFRPIERKDRNVVAALRLERPRQLDIKAGFGRAHSHLSR